MTGPPPTGPSGGPLNAIRRWIQLVLDPNSAKKTEEDAKRALGGIEAKLGALGRMARWVGGLLAGAFGVRALIRFGFESVRMAAESERAWADLKGTVDATGESFEDVEDDLHALGKAFQDATIHDSDEFAESLTRLITLTGD